MTVHDTHLVGIPPVPDRIAARARHSLHDAKTVRLAEGIVAFTPTFAEVERLFTQSRQAIGSLTSLAVIHRVMADNPGTVTAFARRHTYDPRIPVAEGLIAWLPLSPPGHAALLSGAFAIADPAPHHLAAQHERSAAIYVWAIHAPGLAGCVGLAFDQMSTPRHRTADLYSRAATARGRRLVETLGFEPVETVQKGGAPGLYVFRRHGSPLGRPLYDTYPGTGQRHSVAVVRSWDDLAKVMAVRSAAFIAEQACPFDEEFDGNDFSSTHLLGYVGNEPAASLRIRCFADFAKVERLAVRREYRRSRLAFVIVKAAHELCRIKGYRRVYGHAQKRLVPFWSQAGARVFAGAREFAFSDFDYVEMVAEIPRHPEAISIGTDPFVIIRPEGRWHTTGILEKSSARAVTRPSVDPT